MKRYLLVGLAAIAVVGAGANAAVLQFQVLPPAAGSTIGTTADGSMSTNGKYVAGYGYDTSIVSYAFPVYWTVNPDTGAAPVRTNGNGGWGAGTYTGVDQKGAGTVWTGANAGSTVYSANNFTGRYGNPIIAGSLLDHNGASSMVTTGGNNCVAATSNGADVWIAGSWTAGSSKGSDGQIWRSFGGALLTTAAYHPTHSSGTKVDLRSIASNGNAVGQAKDAIGWTGATGRPRAVYWTTANTGAVLNIPPFAGSPAVTESQGFGVSDDGTKFVGLGWCNIDANARGFVWTMGDANSIKLERPTGWQGTPTAVYAYDVTNNGVVAGNAYMDDGLLPGGLAGNHDTGTLWFPGQTVGVRAIDLLMAAGVYDPMIRHLGRVYSIAEVGTLSNGTKAYAISGEGSYWLDPGKTTYGTRAWYAVIPEPATLGFLALGGLAMLRRRR